jgi:NADH-quinone oxidoreductase subunit D
VIAKGREVMVDVDKLLTRNRIFRDRMDGIGIITKEDCCAYGVTGPMARSAGLAYDIRKDHPYLVYDRFDFDVPIGSVGRQLRPLRRARRGDVPVDAHHRAGAGEDPRRPVLVNDPRITLPPKSETYNSIEAMISHFKLIMDGIRVPPGEIYSFTEGGNGELGFYIVSDGTGRPWKCRAAPPSFANTSILNSCWWACSWQDVVPTFGYGQHDRRGV